MLGKGRSGLNPVSSAVLKCLTGLIGMLGSRVDHPLKFDRPPEQVTKRAVRLFISPVEPNQRRLRATLGFGGAVRSLRLLATQLSTSRYALRPLEERGSTDKYAFRKGPIGARNSQSHANLGMCLQAPIFQSLS